MIAALLLAQLVAADRIALAGRTIRVANVVAGSSLRTPVATLPLAAREATLSRHALAALVRRQAGVRVDTAGDGDIRFVPQVARRAPLAYVPPAPAIARGAPIEIATAVGPVRIVRSVTALADARAGRGVFVRDADGRVFAARVPGAAR